MSTCQAGPLHQAQPRYTMAPALPTKGPTLTIHPLTPPVSTMLLVASPIWPIITYYASTKLQLQKMQSTTLNLGTKPPKY